MCHYGKDKIKEKQIQRALPLAIQKKEYPQKIESYTET